MDEDKRSVVGVKRFPMHEANPFGETTIIKKKNSVMGLGPMDAVINTETGEIKGHQRLVISKKVDGAQFVKVFTENLQQIFNLQPPSIKVLFYFIQKAGKDRDIVDFDIDECMKTCQYKSNKSIFAALADLLENELIARAYNAREYFINPGIIFNGNRLTVVHDYHKVNKAEPGQNNVEQKEEQKKIEQSIEQPHPTSPGIVEEDDGEDTEPFGE